MRISDWSSDVCSSDLGDVDGDGTRRGERPGTSLHLLVPDQLHGLLQLRPGLPAGISGPGALQGSAHPSAALAGKARLRRRSEEHTSELQSLMRISYDVFCLKKKRRKKER